MDSNKEIKFYFEKKIEVNDATFFYIEIIRCSIKKIGFDCKIVTSLFDVKKNDIVFVLNAKAFFKLIIKNPFQKIFIWFQGIAPEEMLVYHKSSKFKYLRKILWTMFEFIALKYSKLSLFVSHAMHEHYIKKYNFKGKYFIMPCFSMGIEKNYFFITQKYSSPTFVYSGSLMEWQCIDEVLHLNKTIETFLPHSVLFFIQKILKMLKQK